VPVPPATPLRRALAAAVLLPALSVPTCIAAPAPGPPTATVAWTARVLYPVAARRAPKPNAAVRVRLMHYSAFSRRPNVLLVTGTASDARGRRWVRVLLPQRPNGSQAWVPRAAVALHGTHLRLRIGISARRLQVLRAGRVIARYPVGVGTGGTPTPTGHFAIQDPVTAPNYVSSYLGPYIITLTAHSNVLREFAGGDGLVAIHGTNAPGTIGAAASHGCIRIGNEALQALWRIAAPGTPVDIVP
jgi:lipoprotein-anchoring transpeptidase ErfK/SrfK